MHDQTLVCKKLDVSSITLSDDCGKTQAKEIKGRGCRILLTSPEAALTTYHEELNRKAFQEKLTAVVINESHVIVKW